MGPPAASTTTTLINGCPEPTTAWYLYSIQSMLLDCPQFVAIVRYLANPNPNINSRVCSNVQTRTPIRQLYSVNSVCKKGILAYSLLHGVDWELIVWCSTGLPLGPRNITFLTAWGDDPLSLGERRGSQRGSALHYRQKITLDLIVPKAVHSYIWYFIRTVVTDGLMLFIS